ncbi:MAG: hypothetical protein QXH26_04885 [Candidatus Hadarchaeales archaeon]
MRIERLKYLFLLLVVSSWVLAVLCYARVGGEPPELSKLLTVPTASSWRLPAYFALTVVAAFFLSQIGFGIAAGPLSFLRGLADAPMLQDLAGVLSLQVPEGAVFKALVVVGNSPLFLWSLVLGAERSLYLLWRLWGRPVPPAAGTFKELVSLISVSLLAGLICTLAGVK